MRKRIALLVTALMLALTMAFGSAGAAFADPDCTGPKNERPKACHKTGEPGPSNFVAGGGGALAPNHY
jgi:hypothetical protein